MATYNFHFKGIDVPKIDGDKTLYFWSEKGQDFWNLPYDYLVEMQRVTVEYAAAIQKLGQAAAAAKVKAEV